MQHELRGIWLDLDGIDDPRLGIGRSEEVGTVNAGALYLRPVMERGAQPGAGFVDDAGAIGWGHPRLTSGIGT